MKEKKNEARKLYEEKGGLRLGKSYWVSSNFTWPYADINIFRNRIVIDHVFGKIEFKKGEIENIEKCNGMLGGILGKGVRVFHKKRKFYPFVVFWSLNVDNLIKELKRAGYKVK